ncbi:hypothetical protein D3C75_1107780 [compost metagenome]
MADNHILHAQILQHDPADFAGVGAIVFKVKILRANLDGGALNSLYKGRQVGERGANHALHACKLSLALHFISEGCCFLDGFEHFPVAGNDRCSAHRGPLLIHKFPTK